jgi:beta-lactam-binding protein with PASTA domain
VRPLAYLLAAVIAIGVVQAASATGDAAAAVVKVQVPSVVGLRLDRATRAMHDRGLRVNEECNGVFGCIIKRRWVVCDQDPEPGSRVRRGFVVAVYADRPGKC